MRGKTNARFGQPTLEQLVHLDLLEQESPKKIKSLWVNHHRTVPNSLCAVVEPDTYAHLISRTHEAFVLPRS
jgi:ATP11 protein